jgi:hypothetical protein
MSGHSGCEVRLTRSAVLFLHSRIQGQNVSIRVTDVEGALAPRLGSQLLDHVDLQPAQPGGLRVDIRDFQLNQDPVIGRASQRPQPERCTLRGCPEMLLGKEVNFLDS